jgi:hypothetical protein
LQTSVYHGYNVAICVHNKICFCITCRVND